jgi:putative membrane protein
MANKDNKLITRDWLAIERTRLANERTFLAYFRTFMVFLGGGISLLEMEVFAEIRYLGFVLLALAPVILLVGAIRLVKVRNTIRKYYQEEQ